MHVELKDLKETTAPLKHVQPYPAHEPMGFYDEDGQFMVVVTYRREIYKKRIPKKQMKIEKVAI